MRKQIFGIIIGVALIISGILGFYVREQNIELYKPPIIELQDNLDNIEGIGDTLKVRISGELYVWIDEINQINQNKIKEIRLYSMYMIGISIAGILFVVLNTLSILLNVNEFHLINEHRATQKIILEEDKE